VASRLVARKLESEVRDGLKFFIARKERVGEGGTVGLASRGEHQENLSVGGGDRATQELLNAHLLRKLERGLGMKGLRGKIYFDLPEVLPKQPSSSREKGAHWSERRDWVVWKSPPGQRKPKRGPVPENWNAYRCGSVEG